MAISGPSRSGSSITIGSVPNFRDIGGYATAGGGRVRAGVLYRSAALNALSDADLPAFRALGIRAIFDLRTHDERSMQPNPAMPDVRTVALDVLADATEAAPAQLESALADPAAVARVLGGNSAVRLFQQGYRDIVSLPSARRAYRQFFSDLADAGSRPALVHCSTGKDRTGWAAAVALMLAGVSRDDVMNDYLLTNQDLLPALQPVFAQFERAGGDPEILRPILGVQPDYLDTALAEMHARFGSLEAYLSDGLSLADSTLSALRAALAEPGTATSR